MPNHPCPPGADLLRLVRGELAAHDAEVLEKHLLQCSGCFEKSKALDAQAGKAPAPCHEGATPSESGNTSPEVKALVQRICALLPPPAPSGDARAAAAPPQPDGGAMPTAEVANYERDGNRIGPYKLLQKLGEGGMGAVFLAEQEHPVKRRVALKVIKEGLDSAHVLARFEAERQALAMMDHPNIARVLEVGATADGRPYFVMDLVEGIAITKYCDQERLTLKERLALFVPVCMAVQHAHQKGIIHRDLKPSNVLVALYDGQPVPKVIDFGVAKATGPKLTERTMFTEVGQIVGTLEYMSPEQAELNQFDIDTRSDIYSLGVLLYELLAGGPPFTGKELRSVGVFEMLRIIREVEPPKPSTKLSGSDALPAIAAKRKLEPKRLAQEVQGELDWIVIKCLEKERGRRDQTATGLAEDVQRYLHDEPVAACPPSAWYRFRKFTRRHRAGLGTALAATVVLLLAIVGVSYALWDRAAQAAARQAEFSKRLAETQQAVNVALAKAEQLRDQAAAMPSTKSEEAEAGLVVWRQAEAALGQAETALRTGTADHRLQQRVLAMQQQLDLGRSQTEGRRTQLKRKDKLLSDLDEAPWRNRSGPTITLNMPAPLPITPPHSQPMGWISGRMERLSWPGGFGPRNRPCARP